MIRPVLSSSTSAIEETSTNSYKSMSLILSRAADSNNASSITTKYPDLDCLFLNAGQQTVFNLTEPEKVDLAKFHSEMAVNFGSFVDLTLKFLPFFKAKDHSTSIV